MTEPLHLCFVKGHGTGNDFVLIDDRVSHFPVSNAKLIAHLCDRRRGIGGDGLVLLQNSSYADYRMRYFNADGGEVSLCGNALRCLSLFIAFLGDSRTILTIETEGSSCLVEREGSLVSVRFSSPKLLKSRFTLPLSCGSRDVFFVDSGVPHAILFTKDIDNEEVELIGKEIRHHTLFAPSGTNVNFVFWDGGDGASIRTYERGVEGETLSCGTGTLAAAFVLMHFTKARSMTFTTRSQEPLVVDTSTWELKGKAHLSYKGFLIQEAGQIVLI